MTSDTVLAHFSDSDSLAHYGVKGMKWGVRKDRRGNVKARSVLKKTKKDPLDIENQVSRRDAIDKFNEKNAPRGYGLHYANKPDALRKTMLKARPKIVKEIRQINKSEKYKKADLRRASKLRDEYYKDISDAVTKQLNAASDLKGANKTREYKLHFKYDVTKDIYPSVSIRSNESGSGRAEARKKARQTRRLSHSDDAEVDEINLKVTWSSTGLIEDLSLPDTNAVEHGSVLIGSMLESDSLAHYGVKGMKWGVRKDRKKSGGGRGSGNTKKADNKGKTSGGRAQDLIRKAKDKASTKLQERKAKKQEAKREEEQRKLKQKPLHDAIDKHNRKSSNTINKRYRDLSNEELRTLNERMRLEKEYDDLITYRAKQNRTPTQKLAGWATETTVSIAGDLVKKEMRKRGAKILARSLDSAFEPPKPTKSDASQDVWKKYSKKTLSTLSETKTGQSYKYEGRHRKTKTSVTSQDLVKRYGKQPLSAIPKQKAMYQYKYKGRRRK